MFPASLSGEYDEIRLTFGNLMCVLSRQALLFSMREEINKRYEGPDKRAYCLIPALNIYLLASDARTLTTLKEATLEIDENASDLAYIKTGVRSKPLEALHNGWKIKIVKPDNTCMSFARNDLRFFPSGRTQEECIYVPNLGGVSIKTISIIENSNYKTFHLRSIETPKYLL